MNINGLYSIRNAFVNGVKITSFSIDYIRFESIDDHVDKRFCIFYVITAINNTETVVNGLLAQCATCFAFQN